MREIKFRAWDKKESKMYDVAGISPHNEVMVAKPLLHGGSQYVLLEDIHIKKYQIFYKDDGVLMQYTGLKDKNGKEIYEGDILLGRFILDEVEDHIFLSLTEDEKETQSIVFVVDDIFYPYTNQIPEDLEVIGNIYENPELLSKLNK